VDDHFCTEACTPGVGGVCPSDFSCRAAEDGSGVCWPKAGGCCGAHHGEGHFCVREDGTGQHCGHHELGDPVSGHPHRHMRA